MSATTIATGVPSPRVNWRRPVAQSGKARRICHPDRPVHRRLTVSAVITGVANEFSLQRAKPLEFCW